MAPEQAKKQNEKPKKQIKTGCGDIVSDFIEDVWQVMTPEMVDHLKCILTEDMGMTKKDADTFIARQRDIRRERICLKKENRVVRIGPRNQWIKELSRDIGDQMALFIVGILFSNRNARTKRITEKVLDHFCEITGENTTMDSAKTRVERTMVVVADRMAAWIDEAVTDIESKMKDRFPLMSSAEDLSTFTSESSETESTATDICDTPVISRESILLTRETFSDKSIILEEGKEDAEREEDETEEEETDSKEFTDEEKSEEGSEESTGEEETEDVQSEEEVDEELEAEEEEDTEEEESEQEGEKEQEEEEEEDEEATLSVRSEEESEEGTGDKLEASLETLPSTGRLTSAEVTVGDLGRLSDVASEEKQMLVDLLELLKEDFTRIPKEVEKTVRQKAMKHVIDMRFEEIVREKLDKSLDSFVKYDINEAASTVANWIERVLESADAHAVTTSVIQPYLKQGSAYEIMRGDGSQYKVSKLSSATVTQKVAAARGFEPPLRKKKIPRTMSPMNLKSTRDWADWALGAAKVGQEWGDWLDRTFTEVERQLLGDRGSANRVERYEEWRNWKSKRGVEAIKWRVEKQRIKDEATLWSRKLQKEFHKPEKETRTFSY